MMVATQSWAFNGELKRGFTLAQLVLFSWCMVYDRVAYTFERGRPSSLAKAQKTLPVPILVRQFVD